MRRFLKELFSAPFQLVLVISFSLVAATTIAVGTWVISRTIRDYLAEAMTERVERDMRLAEGFYSAKLREVAGIADRLALDPQVRSGLAGAAAQGGARRPHRQRVGGAAVGRQSFRRHPGRCRAGASRPDAAHGGWSISTGGERRLERAAGRQAGASSRGKPAPPRR